MSKDTFTMKINYVKVVGELLQMKNKVMIDGKEMSFCEVVEKAMRRNMRPYFTTDSDKKDWEKEQYDRSFNGDYEKWGI